jgi:hypothetical protein
MWFNPSEHDPVKMRTSKPVLDLVLVLVHGLLALLRRSL